LASDALLFESLLGLVRFFSRDAAGDIAVQINARCAPLAGQQISGVAGIDAQCQADLSNRSNAIKCSNDVSVNADLQRPPAAFIGLEAAWIRFSQQFDNGEAGLVAVDGNGCVRPSVFC
jgi:hypothetical protein